MKGKTIMHRDYYKHEWRLRDIEEWERRILEVAATLSKKR